MCCSEHSDVRVTSYSRFLFTAGAMFDTLNADYVSLYGNQHVKDVALLRVPANPRLLLTERDCMLGFTVGLRKRVLHWEVEGVAARKGNQLSVNFSIPFMNSK